jgi:hypothetical protein
MEVGGGEGAGSLRNRPVPNNCRLIGSWRLSATVTSPARVCCQSRGRLIRLLKSADHAARRTVVIDDLHGFRRHQSSLIQAVGPNTGSEWHGLRAIWASDAILWVLLHMKRLSPILVPRQQQLRVSLGEPPFLELTSSVEVLVDVLYLFGNLHKACGCLGKELRILGIGPIIFRSPTPIDKKPDCSIIKHAIGEHLLTDRATPAVEKGQGGERDLTQPETGVPGVQR